MTRQQARLARLGILRTRALVPNRPQGGDHELRPADARHRPVSLPAPQLARLRQRAFRLAYVTMTWMVAEAAIAIAAGVITASIALIGFGLDSVIELMSAGIVIWQLRGEMAGQDRQTRA